MKSPKVRIYIRIVVSICFQFQPEPAGLDLPVGSEENVHARVDDEVFDFTSEETVQISTAYGKTQDGSKIISHAL